MNISATKEDNVLTQQRTHPLDMTTFGHSHSGMETGTRTIGKRKSCHRMHFGGIAVTPNGYGYANEHQTAN